MEQLETSKRNLKLSQMFNYTKKKKGFLVLNTLCVIHKKFLKILCLDLKVNVPFKENGFSSFYTVQVQNVHNTHMPGLQQDQDSTKMSVSAGPAHKLTA